MEESSINYRYLIDKAKKKWQLSLAKICTLPVKIMIWVVNIYMGFALLFGLMAIVLFIGSLFDNDGPYNPKTIVLLYIPFFAVFFICFVFSKVQFLKRISTVSLYIICNLILYVIPLLYGMYKLRHCQLESYLQTVEYNRNRDICCDELIEVYSKRKATFKVWVRNKMVYNGHVGHEWNIRNFINSVPIGSEPIFIELSDKDIIGISTMAIESDVFSDYGKKTTRFKIPWSILVDGRKNFTHNIYVKENRGSFSGSMCKWESTFFIERCKEEILEKRKEYNVPEDSITKYFFNFKKIYIPKYVFEDEPWKKYMTDGDKYDLSYHNKHYDIFKRSSFDEESEYAIH